MTPWLKLVGAADWPVPEHWVAQRSDLLHEVRFGRTHPPEAIALGDHLVYHAVGDRRLIAIVEVTDAEARDLPRTGEERWPLVRAVRPVMKIGRVSQAPSTDILNLPDDLRNQSFVKLGRPQYEQASAALRAAGAR